MRPHAVLFWGTRSDQGWPMTERVEQEQSSVRFALLVFAASAGLWLLSYVDWLPAGIANILAPPGENRAGLRESLLGMAILGLGLATVSYFRLRADRLATRRAERLANAVSIVLGSAAVLV